jgi:hypothetical protein
MHIMTFTTSGETIKLQFKSPTSTNCKVYRQRLIAVKLSDLGIDSNSTESEGESSTSSLTYQNKVTKTFTPSPNKQGDYLVMGFAMLNGNNTTTGH